MSAGHFIARRWRWLRWFIPLLLLAAPALAQMPDKSMPAVNITVGGGSETGSVSAVIQIVVVMTFLTLAPSIIMLMTSFIRRRCRCT